MRKSRDYTTQATGQKRSHSVGIDFPDYNVDENLQTELIGACRGLKAKNE